MFKKNLRLLFIFFLALLHFGWGVDSQTEGREIKVGIAVAPSFKMIKGWQEKFKQRLAYTSQIFESEFKIKFIPHVFWDWIPKSEKEDSGMLLAELRETFPLHGIDMVVGLVKLSKIPKLEDMSDVDTLGRARPFSGYVLIRYPNNPLYRVQEETVLTHEIAHIFGATHTDDPMSVMSPRVQNQIPTRFDAANRDVIFATRRIDFKAGVESLDAATSGRLLAAYQILMRGAQPMDFYYMLGVFYLNTGNSQDAIAAWEKAAQYDEFNPYLLSDLGRLFSMAGHYDKAEKTLAKALAGFYKPWQKKRKVEALLYLGEAYLKQNKIAAAYDAFSRAVAIDPQNPEVGLNLAITEIYRQRPKIAINKLKTILSRDGTNIKAMAYLGIAYDKAGFSAEAAKTLADALRMIQKKKDPAGSAQISSDIYNALGNIYMKGNDTKQALASYAAACQVLDTPACREHLGRFLFRLQKYPEAAAELGKVLAVRKDDAELYGITGVSLSMANHPEQAIAMFKEGLNYAKDKKVASMLHRNLGHLYLQFKHPDLAVQEFRMAVTGDYRDVEAHIGLALAEIQLNRYSSAKSELKTALSLDPGNAKAKKLLADVERALSQEAPITTHIKVRN
ncbi:MAG: tetratricopeptide repeat protein [Candidatus Omnitrophota bacterium]